MMAWSNCRKQFSTVKSVLDVVENKISHLLKKVFVTSAIIQNFVSPESLTVSYDVNAIHSVLSVKSVTQAYEFACVSETKA